MILLRRRQSCEQYYMIICAVYDEALHTLNKRAENLAAWVPETVRHAQKVPTKCKFSLVNTLWRDGEAKVNSRNRYEESHTETVLHEQ